LLTKAYFLGLLLGMVFLGMRDRTRLKGACTAVLVGCGWYVRNVLIGYSVSGWLDQAPLSRVLSAVVAVNWFRAAQITAKSFFWFGAWSFLTLRSWIYAVVNVVGIVAAVRGFRRELLVPWIFVGCIFAEMAFGVLNYQAMHGIGSLPGWYAWVAGGMMAMIVGAGLGRSTWFLILGLAAIDIYGASLLARHFHSGPIWLWIIPLAAAGPAVTVGSFRQRPSVATS
jgi:hypothetical protein